MTMLTRSIFAFVSLLLVSSLAIAQDDGGLVDPGVTAVYVDAEGNLVDIVDEDLQAGNLVFYAWMQDREGGVDPTLQTAAEPLDEERMENAPSGTQNLVVGFVGYRDAEGNLFPVAGATIRWQIDPFWGNAQGSVVFGAVDAAGEATVAGELGIDNYQATTLTNNGNVFNRARFPVANDYPLYNATGLTTPDTGGASWVTLFSPDPRARARVIAVASVNGVEIGKEVLTKNFAPAPELQVEKSVDVQSINLGVEGEGRATFTVTVTNVGEGDAMGVTLRDALNSGSTEGYTVVGESITDAGEAVETTDDAFTRRFDLPAGESRELTFQAAVTETDTYCNVAVIEEFTGEFDVPQRGELRAEACFEAIRPELTIIKDFVDENGESLGDAIEVGADQEAQLRVRVINRGGAVAEGLTVEDALTEGTAENYEVVQFPEGVEQQGPTAFTGTIDQLEADQSQVYVYPVLATADGEYCDVATLRVGGEVVAEDNACLTVATPELTIDKEISRTAVAPGNSYTSTITVTNTGNAVAREVLVSDVLASNSDDTVFLVYVGSGFDNASGTFEQGEQLVVAPSTVDLGPGDTAVLEVTSRVPEGIAPDTYCNVGMYESANAGAGQVERCVDVPAFAALQTAIVDSSDPVVAGNSITYTSTLFNEPRSNEVVENNEIVFSFGVQENVEVGRAGMFEVTSTEVYFNESPLRDPTTGAVASVVESGELLTEGDQYTLSADEAGVHTLTLNAALPPNSVVYVVHEVLVPEDISAAAYSTNFTWTAQGRTSGTEYNPQGAEPTTVIAP